LLDGVTRPRVFRLNNREEIKDMRRACGRPQGEKPVIRIGEASPAADRHETRVTVFGKDHTLYPLANGATL
jgi:hypothetical protein